MEHTDDHEVTTFTNLAGEQHHACTETGCSWIAVTLPDEALDDDTEKERRLRSHGYDVGQIAAIREDIAGARLIGQDEFADALREDWKEFVDGDTFKNLLGTMSLIHAAFVTPDETVEISGQHGPYRLRVIVDMPEGS